jgi:galactokinase/mevalonate kinase-like predicted kinase
VEERIRTFQELVADAGVASPFSVARTAFRLAGFDPAFSGDNHAALRDLLNDFGGGVELSLLAAVPKGSGLGTSSILAGTILGALGDFCGLGWDQAEIFRRVLVLEQMLTTGGGWQDQVGGLVRGLKYVETSPALPQSPQIRWLPDHLFTDPETQQCMLLYYTGVTRIAKSILQEIVRGMFLNNRTHQVILREIAQHTVWSYDTLIRGSYEGLCHCVSRSWELNQRLDSGTNPPLVQTILDGIGDLCAAAKLAGAGGGGYLFMLAKDPEAAARIRHILSDNPPNEKSRFVECRLSPRGLEITRS